MHVLLVEDNLAEARLTCEAFREIGLEHSLYHVTNGERATQYLRHQNEYEQGLNPNNLLLDLNLSGKNGREVLWEVESHPKLHSIPVIAVSNSRSREDVGGVYRRHGNGCLIKPVDFEEVVLMVRSLADFWFEREHLKGMMT